MRSEEWQEIATLPPKYRPMTAWAYFGWSIVFGIPVIGFILLIIMAVSSGNINRRSFARSYFCGLILSLIVVGAFLALGGVAVATDLLASLLN